MGSHSITCHPAELTISAFTPKKTGTRFSDPEGMQNDRVDLDDWLHREMVYPPEDGHPSK